MKLNIIHLPHRTDRMELLMKELEGQGITNYQIWDGIIDREHAPRGISQAHKQIVRAAKAEGLPQVLIGEDDMHFTDKGAFEYFLNNQPQKFDIFLGGIYYGIIGLEHLVTDFSGLTLYIVRERYYDTFLELDEKKNIDRAMAKTGRFVVCHPFVVTQHNTFSDNIKKEVNYDSWLVGRHLFKSSAD